jgi:hypothetical protein
MTWKGSAKWFEVRTAHNRKPATYRCPLCGRQLPALMDHMLIFPEGDHSRRRHAHSQCVMQARKAGGLPSRDEWQRAQRRKSGEPEPPSGLVAAFRRLRRGRERSDGGER